MSGKPTGVRLYTARLQGSGTLTDILIQSVADTRPGNFYMNKKIRKHFNCQLQFLVFNFQMSIYLHKVVGHVQIFGICVEARMSKHICPKNMHEEITHEYFDYHDH